MKPDAIILVELLPTLRGGRNGATPASQFGCVFEINGEYFDCRLDLSKSGPLLPGSSATVPVAFLYPENVVPRLTEGMQFNLWEGKTIATGRIVSISTT